MKPQKTPSAYAKMYLVTPSVYEKLLECIDEKDKRETELLNIEANKPIEERPSEMFVDNLNREALDLETTENNPQPVEIRENDNPNVEEEMQPSGEEVEIASNEPENIQGDGEDENLTEEAETNLEKKYRKMRKQHTCTICLKTFDRFWSLSRHMQTVHKNLKLVETSPNITKTIPVTQGFQSLKQYVPISATQVLQDTDVDLPDEMPLAEFQRIKKQQTLQPPQNLNNPLKTPCKTSADNTNRVCPQDSIIYGVRKSGEGRKSIAQNLARKIVKRAANLPPLKRNSGKIRIIKPTIKKPILYVPQLMTKTTRPSNMDISEPSTSFQTWGNKKMKTRTASDAKLPNKPAKWRPGDDDFAAWQ